MMSRPEWLVPGAEVAVLHIRSHTRKVTFTTIDRVLKRDVVLTNGMRFNADRLYDDGPDTYSTSLSLLLQRDDARVSAALAEQRLRTLCYKLKTSLQNAHDEISPLKRFEIIQATMEELKRQIDETLGGYEA
jgi:hypothetical protein